MKWSIPAKTFLLGEYAALQGASAMVLTTSPCFEMSLTTDKTPNTLHPDSPAARWWTTLANTAEHSLTWHDPHQGLGGLGASSAQFLGAWLAGCHLSGQKTDLNAMLQAYEQSAWQGQGLRPSGYDLIAQSQYGCVYINREKNLLECYDWPFTDIAFLLLRSGQKLATHLHLQHIALPDKVHQLSELADDARLAFKNKDSGQLIDAINACRIKLAELKLTAEHSLMQLEELTAQPNVLAAKGCGALGADVLLLIVPAADRNQQINHFITKGWTVAASNNNLYRRQGLIKLSYVRDNFF